MVSLGHSETFIDWAIWSPRTEMTIIWPWSTCMVTVLTYSTERKKDATQPAFKRTFEGFVCSGHLILR